MKYLFAKNFQERQDADVLICPFWEGSKPACSINITDKPWAFISSLKDFKGKHAEIFPLYIEGFKEPRILALGLGAEAKITVDSLRKAFAQVIKYMQQVKISSANVFFPQIASLGHDQTLTGVWEGLCLANYVFNEWKGESSKDSPQPICQINWIDLKEEAKASLDLISTVVEGINFARDLVNHNADDMTPAKIAASAKDLEKESKKIVTTIFDKGRLEKEKMGLILAVNRGSQVDPFLVEVTYNGNPKSEEKIVLVGKGVTYDTGGLSLKPTDSMLSMKCDMGGAACVLATIRTAAKLDLKVNITVVIPTVENAIDAKSYKLGDVYRSYSGKTVEINNTDAEGRLILADALSYVAKNMKPKWVIDVATLTGNVVLALGEHMAGFCSNDSSLATMLIESSSNTTDALWQLPLISEYKDSFKSDIADLVNSGGREAGMIKGALFLQEFIGSCKWAHIDIAGTAFLSKARAYHPTKATGYGVQLLLEFLKKQQ